MTKRVLRLLLALALLATACGGETDEEPPGGTGASSGVGPGISVQEALDSDLDQPLLVNGFLVVQEDAAWLSETIAESFPPQPGGARLRVEGLDLDSIPGLRSSGSVTWSDEPIQLLGTVEDGTLTVSQDASA